jgi:hypothetical protein
MDGMLGGNQTTDDIVQLSGVSTAPYYLRYFNVPAVGALLRLQCGLRLAAVDISTALIVGYLPAHLQFIRGDGHHCTVADSRAQADAYVLVKVSLPAKED